MFRLLERYRVRYILVGGLAAALHGSPVRSGDADICPARDPQNLERLAEALTEMEADTPPTGLADEVAFTCDATVLAGADLHALITRFGPLNIAFRPPGTNGYDDLKRHAEPYDLDGIALSVPSLEDLIASMDTVADARDLAALREILAKRRRR